MKEMPVEKCLNIRMHIALWIYGNTLQELFALVIQKYGNCNYILCSKHNNCVYEYNNYIEWH